MSDGASAPGAASRAVASAPGKVMLAGEYAILDGAEAVMLAVDRRVRAWIEPAGALSGPFLAAVRDQLADDLGRDHPATRAADHVVANSTPLRADDNTKLGLGSSAAVTVAATACALGEPVSGENLQHIHRIAHAAHGRAQEALGARGSGADIAASTFGGVIAVRRRADHAPVAVRSLAAESARHLVYLWTGKAAHTPSLVAQVRALRTSDPALYRCRIAAIAEAADAVVAGFAGDEDGLAPDSRRLVGAVQSAAQAVAELGHAAGVELETDEHRAIAALAGRFAGAAKPTGAGAGDVAVAAFPDSDAKREFCAEAWDRGLTLLDLVLSVHGVDWTPASPSSPDAANR